jgi:uncharacterized protein (TIGR00369 family)
MSDLADSFNARSAGTLPGLLGLRILAIERGQVHAEIPVASHHMAPNGYLHAGTVVTLADTCCGYGAIASLPEGASNFTTIELKSNDLGTARDGHIECRATLFHGGRTTQVWDAVVTHRESDRTLALFRCTQMILYPKAGA